MVSQATTTMTQKRKGRTDMKLKTEQVQAIRGGLDEPAMIALRKVLLEKLEETDSIFYITSDTLENGKAYGVAVTLKTILQLLQGISDVKEKDYDKISW